MTREDVIKILSLIRANYPLVKISDPASMVSAWEMNLGEYDTNLVVKAAKLHMKTSKFFPTPADLINVMARAELVYNDSEGNLPQIEAPKRAKVTVIPDGVSVEDFLDHICQDMIDLENECWPEATQSDDLGGCLPYEK